MRAHTLLQSFRHAFEGLGYALRTQRNARIHALAAVTVAGLGSWLRISPGEWAMLVLTVGFVFSFELLNTMVETLVDLVSPEHHPLARTAKDVAAAAVLVSAVLATVVGLIILGPPLWKVLMTAPPT